jgi:hypothetical protein
MRKQGITLNGDTNGRSLLRAAVNGRSLLRAAVTYVHVTLDHHVIFFPSFTRELGAPLRALTVQSKHPMSGKD